MKHISSTLFLALSMLLNQTTTAIALNTDSAGYIVVFKEDVRAPAETSAEIAQRIGGKVGFIYEHALKGFSINLPPQAAKALERNPNVSYVVKDNLKYAFTQRIPTGIQRIFAEDNPKIDIEGTDNRRIDVDVAVIDTGVDLDHPDLNVLTTGVDCTGSPIKAKCRIGGDDDHYHGTHVAGTIGAIDNGFGVVGVAPGARIWPVKVLNKKGWGYSSWIIAGIDWVTENADKIEVANMSLGGEGYNRAEYEAIEGAVNKGVAFAVSAGNKADDAANYSPAAFNNVLTVSALADFDGLPGGNAVASEDSEYSFCRPDVDDTLADFSNWGESVDIAAPGVCIQSTFPLEKGGYGVLSGTSMAAPHVAGALALLASRYNPGSADDVFFLYSEVTQSGNLKWSDDSGDGILEPLLDLSDTTTFAPVVDAGSGDEGEAIDLEVVIEKERNIRYAVLAWSGLTSDTVAVFRDGELIHTGDNVGEYIEKVSDKVDSAAYLVCEGESDVCSNTFEISW